jgi:hypothetical protein
MGASRACAEGRAAFAAFLERVAEAEVAPEVWQEFLVNHYHDEPLEEIRRQCVRLAIQKPTRSWTEEERHQLLSWAQALRGTSDG